MSQSISESVDLSKEPDLDALTRALAVRVVDPVGAEKQLIALAERGSSLSMVHLGYMYAHREVNRGGPDLIEAERWYKLAINSGSKIATYNLGSMYLTQKDYLRAKETFEVGDEMNYGPSVFSIWDGCMYMDSVLRKIMIWHLPYINGRHPSEICGVSLLLQP